MDILEVIDIAELPVERIIRDRTNPFDLYDDNKFKLRYRFNKNTTHNIMNLLNEDLIRPTERHMALSPETQVRNVIHI